MHTYPPITLYSYATSPYAMKVHCYLLYKQLPFKIIYVNPLHAAKELPIGKQIPVLQIDGEARAESSAIGIWLDNVFPNTARLLPTDIQLKKRVLELDQWVTEQLIPIIFLSVYPQINHLLPQYIKNTLRLGYCIEQTTHSYIPSGIRFLWPFLIWRTHFIRQMVIPLMGKKSIQEHRMNALAFMNEALRKHTYLANTEHPTLADLSTWPQIYVPYQLGLKGMDDFMTHPHIIRWVEEIKYFLDAPKHSPLLVPNTLRCHQ